MERTEDDDDVTDKAQYSGDRDSYMTSAEREMTDSVDVKPESPPEIVSRRSANKLDQSRAPSNASSASTPSAVHMAHPDMFAMFNPDFMANLHLQSQMLNGQFLPRFPLPVSLANGFPPHPELLKRLQQPNSPPLGALVNGQSAPTPNSHQHDAGKLPPRMPGHGGAGSGDLKADVVTSSASNNCQVLDTAEVALKIREVLSANNIGQRLFAKHVLGLSQGTVSELLSKPKHWDKLTEKGRESYRKMHAWATNQPLVEALKAISPKKGQHPSSNSSSFVQISSFTIKYLIALTTLTTDVHLAARVCLTNVWLTRIRVAGSQPIVSNSKQESAQTEERIAAILNEAQAAMALRQSQERVRPCMGTISKFA